MTSAASPSAPRAAALNEVAIEKKITVPLSAVARMAPPSQPGTSTQTMVRSAGPPAADDSVAQRHRVAGVADHDLVGEAGAGTVGLEQVGLALVGYDGDRAAGAGPSGGGQAQGAGLAGASDDRRPPGRRTTDVPLGQRRGAADVHHGQSQR